MRHPHGMRRRRGALPHRSADVDRSSSLWASPMTRAGTLPGACLVTRPAVPGDSALRHPARPRRRRWARRTASTPSAGDPWDGGRRVVSTELTCIPFHDSPRPSSTDGRDGAVVSTLSTPRRRLLIEPLSGSRTAAAGDVGGSAARSLPGALCRTRSPRRIGGASHRRGSGDLSRQQLDLRQVWLRVSGERVAVRVVTLRCARWCAMRSLSAPAAPCPCPPRRQSL
jgi:hypothetical protein